MVDAYRPKSIDVEALRAEIRRQREGRKKLSDNLERTTSQQWRRHSSGDSVGAVMIQENQSRSASLLRIYQIPVLGYIVRLLTGVFNLPKIIGNLYKLHEQVKENSGRLHELESRTRAEIQTLQQQTNLLRATGEKADESEREHRASALASHLANSERQAIELARAMNKELAEIRAEIAEGLTGLLRRVEESKVAAREQIERLDASVVALRSRHEALGRLRAEVLAESTAKSAELMQLFRAEAERLDASDKDCLARIERVRSVVVRIMRAVPSNDGFSQSRAVDASEPAGTAQVHEPLSKQRIAKGSVRQGSDILAQMALLSNENSSFSTATARELDMVSNASIQQQLAKRVEYLEELIASIVYGADGEAAATNAELPTIEMVGDPAAETNFYLAASGVSRVALVGSKLEGASADMFDIMPTSNGHLHDLILGAYSSHTGDNVALLNELRDCVRQFTSAMQGIVFGPLLELLSDSERRMALGWISKSQFGSALLVFQLGHKYWVERSSSNRRLAVVPQSEPLHASRNLPPNDLISQFSLDFARVGLKVQICMLSSVEADGANSVNGGVIVVSRRDE